MTLWKKWKNKLWIQLGMAILVVNLSVLLLSFLFQYKKIEEILLENAEESSVEWFRQSETNITRFCEQIDKLLIDLVLSDDIMYLSDYSKLSNADIAFYNKRIMGRFAEMVSQYPYIVGITYYGDDGYVMKSSVEKQFTKRDTKKEDWYYSSEIYQDNTAKRLTYLAGYTNHDFELDRNEVAQTYRLISLSRRTPRNMGKMIVHCDAAYFLDIFFSDEQKTGNEIYVIDESNRIVAARDASLVGTLRIFGEGEQGHDGVERYIEESQEGQKQVIVYPLSSMGWKLVKESLISDLTKERREIKNILLIACIISLLISFVLSVGWITRMLQPLKLLVIQMKKIREGKLGTTIEEWPGSEINQLAQEFNRMSTELQEMFLHNQIVEEEKREFEMAALRAQINPHLLYNTLNTIKWMALVKKEMNIARSIVLLSDFLEPVFKDKNQMCFLKEELDYLKKYVEIMNLRSGEMYVVESTIPEKWYECQVIRFLLQPIVENAILHGFKENGAGKIRISMEQDGEDGILLVEDDGKGMEKSKLRELQYELTTNSKKESGIGITNVNRRLKIQYGENYGVTVRNGETRGFAVELRIRL